MKIFIWQACVQCFLKEKLIKTSRFMLNMGTGREKVNLIILNCFNYEWNLPEFMYNEIKKSVKVIFNPKKTTHTYTIRKYKTHKSIYLTIR